MTMADVSSRRYVIVPVTTLWSSPTSPRDVDAAAVAPHPDVVAWLADLDAAAARLGLHGRALTQLELDEPVEIIDDPDNGWLQVVAPMQPSTLDPRGYPGWLPAAHVSAQVPDRAPISAGSDSLEGGRGAGAFIAAARKRLEGLIERIRGGDFVPTETPSQAICFGCPAAWNLCPHPAWRPRG